MGLMGKEDRRDVQLCWPGGQGHILQTSGAKAWACFYAESREAPRRDFKQAEEVLMTWR